MSDFAFQIVGDASKANKAIDDTLGKLDRVAARAPAVGRELTSAFERAAQIVRNYDQALASNGNNSVKNAQAAQQAARAHAQYVEQLQREQQMFQQIRGPAHQVAQDITTLNSLLAKGAINAAEFNQKLAQIRPPSSRGGAGGFDLSGALGGLPGGALIAGAAGGGVAGAASAGVQTAVGAAHQIVEMSDAYVNMNNRLRTLTGTTEGAHDAFEKVLDVANRTRSDLGATTEAFVRISNATKQMGLSQEQTLSFTERLNELTQLSGATSTEAAASMLQLSQALASGTLRGDEFNSINEQMHPLITLIAQNLHVTEGELRKMAETGKLTAKIIYDSVNKAGTALDQQFAQTTPTISAQFVVLKNEATAAVGKLAQSVDLTKTVGATIKTFGEIAQKAGEQTKFWADQLDRIGISPGDLTGGGYEGLSKLNDMGMDVFKFDYFDKGAARMNDAQQVINRVIAEGTGKLNEYSQAMVESTLRTQYGADAAKGFAEAAYQAANATDPWANAQFKSATALDYVTIALRAGHDVLDKLNEKQKHHRAELSDLEKLYSSLHGPTSQAITDMQNLEILYAQGRISLGLYNQEIAKRNDLLAAARLYELEGLGGVHSMPTAGLGMRAGGMDMVPGVPEAPGATPNASKQEAQSLTRMWHEQLEQIHKDNQRYAQMIAGAWKPVEDAIKNAALTGKFEWSDFAKSMEASLADIAMQVLKTAALTALLGPGGGSGSLGQALFSAIGGGKTGFDYRVGSSGLQLPGFQSGGSITRQPGGPEPMLAMWWMQPNETLSIRTEEQMRRGAAANGNSPPIQVTPTVKVLMPRDRRDIVDDSRDGMTTLVRLQQRMKRGR